MTKDNKLRVVVELSKDDDPDTPNEDVERFVKAMAKFDRDFCEAIQTGVDFTLLLEVSGANGKLNWCRVRPDTFDRRRDDDDKGPRPSVRR